MQHKMQASNGDIKCQRRIVEGTKNILGEGRILFFSAPLYMYIKVKVSHVQLFATPWTIQSMEYSKPEYWSG